MFVTLFDLVILSIIIGSISLFVLWVKNTYPWKYLDKNLGFTMGLMISALGLLNGGFLQHGFIALGALFTLAIIGPFYVKKITIFHDILHYVEDVLHINNEIKKRARDNVCINPYTDDEMVEMIDVRLSSIAKAKLINQENTDLWKDFVESQVINRIYYQNIMYTELDDREFIIAEELWNHSLYEVASYANEINTLYSQSK